MVAGMRALPTIKLARLPRMADFAKWGEAIGHGLGWEEGAFQEAYEQNRTEANETALLDTPLGEFLLKLCDTPIQWECGATELHEALTKKVGPKVAKSKAWPKTPRRFTNELRRLSPQLRMRGLFIIFKREQDRRLVEVVSAAFLACVGAD